MPGSTLRYGSHFWSDTLIPRAFSSVPRDAAEIPLPSPETTPPVTNTYFTGVSTTWPSPSPDDPRHDSGLVGGHAPPAGCSDTMSPRSVRTSCQRVRQSTHRPDVNWRIAPARGPGGAEHPGDQAPEARRAATAIGGPG